MGSLVGLASVPGLALSDAVNKKAVVAVHCEVITKVLKALLTDVMQSVTQCRDLLFFDCGPKLCLTPASTVLTQHDMGLGIEVLLCPHSSAITG